MLIAIVTALLITAPATAAEPVKGGETKKTIASMSAMKPDGSAMSQDELFQLLAKCGVDVQALKSGSASTGEPLQVRCNLSGDGKPKAPEAPAASK